MTDAKLTQAMAELQEVVRCRCDEAYRDRGLKDPHCECDSADAVKVVADRIKDLTDKLAQAVEEMEKVDAYLTRLQTPNTEPLNSVNSCGNKKGRGQYTAMVRNEAREYWVSLGNTLAEIKGESHE